MAKRALIGGNWKCNGTMEQVKTLVDTLNNAGEFPVTSEVVIAVPAIHLAACRDTFRPDIAVCAQDVGYNAKYGAFTGELSAEMLVDSGIKWTLTGHSERRVGFGYPVHLIMVHHHVDTLVKVVFRERHPRWSP
jgi:triosephosphate isomerase